MEMELVERLRGSIDTSGPKPDLWIKLDAGSESTRDIDLANDKSNWK